MLSCSTTGVKRDTSGYPKEPRDAFFEYLREAWGLDAAALDDLASRLATLLPSVRPPAILSRQGALALRDAMDAAIDRVAQGARTIAALCGEPDAARLAAAAARLERYRAREASRAELDRILDLADRLLGGRKPPTGSSPLDPRKTIEARGQSEAGRGRSIEDALRDLRGPTPTTR